MVIPNRRALGSDRRSWSALSCRRRVLRANRQSRQCRTQPGSIPVLLERSPVANRGPSCRSFLRQDFHRPTPSVALSQLPTATAGEEQGLARGRLGGSARGNAVPIARLDRQYGQLVSFQSSSFLPRLLRGHSKELLRFLDETLIVSTRFRRLFGRRQCQRGHHALCR